MSSDPYNTALRDMQGALDGVAAEPRLRDEVAAIRHGIEFIEAQRDVCAKQMARFRELWKEAEREAQNAAPSLSGSMVYCLICIDKDDTAVVHIFSTPEELQKYADTDDRVHVAYDYVIDSPDRMEEPKQ